MNTGGDNLSPMGKGIMAQGYEGAMVEWHKGIMAQWGKGTPVRTWDEMGGHHSSSVPCK